jgi:hypothetical protein
MSEEQRYSEAAESDDELPLTQGAVVQVTKRPAAAVLTSQAEPLFVKVHKSRTSAKQSKQSTLRDLLTVLGKKHTPTAKVGGARLCEEGWCTAAPQFPRVVWALLRAIQQLKMRLRRLESKLQITLKNP